MKKILLYLAAMAALASCSEAPVDELTPQEEGKQVVVSASFESKDTRIEVGTDWGISWEEDDRMMAVETSGSYYTFSRTLGETDPDNATFTGSVSGENDYRMFYPDGFPSVTENKLAVDISYQYSDKLSLPMISDEVIKASAVTPNITMQHVGAVVELKVGLGADNADAKIKSITVTGLNSKSNIDLSKGVAEDDFYGTIDSQKITINLIDKYADADGMVTTRFCALPTSGVKEVKVVVTKADDTTISGSVVTKNNEGNTFARATYNKITTGDIVDWCDYASDGLATAGEISTAEELAWLAKSVNSGTDFEGESFKLTADIDLSAHDWVAIGSLDLNNNIDNPFKGTFDGAGHTISGMKINQAKANYQALFGYTNGATISNLSISGEVSGGSNVGGVLGYGYKSAITNCHSSVKVSGNNYIGGVVGFNNGIIANCYTTGEVSGNTNIGGIAGYNNGTLTNCYNSGKVTAKGDNPTNIGGIAGNNNDGTVTNCYYDSNLNDKGIGSGSATNLVAMLTGDMTQDKFPKELNNNAARFNIDYAATLTVKACAWVKIKGDYPKFKFDTDPILSDSLEQLEEDGSIGDK